MATAMKRLSIPLNAKQHQRIKLTATLQGKTIREYVLDQLLDEKTPNATTMRALKELEAGKNVTVYNSVDEMFEKLATKKKK